MPVISATWEAEEEGLWSKADKKHKTLFEGVAEVIEPEFKSQDCKKKNPKKPKKNLPREHVTTGSGDATNKLGRGQCESR
jgi:hypothetical protein